MTSIGLGLSVIEWQRLTRETFAAIGSEIWSRLAQPANRILLKVSRPSDAHWSSGVNLPRADPHFESCNTSQENQSEMKWIIPLSLLRIRKFFWKIKKFDAKFEIEFTVFRDDGLSVRTSVAMDVLYGFVTTTMVVHLRLLYSLRSETVIVSV